MRSIFSCPHQLEAFRINWKSWMSMFQHEQKNHFPLIQSALTNEFTRFKVSKYRVSSVPCFPVFGPNTGKYGPQKTPYLDTFHAVIDLFMSNICIM